MKNLFFLLCFAAIFACENRQNHNKYPVPTQIRERQEETEKERLYEQYLEASHGAGLYDWRAIEAENKQRNIAYKKALRHGTDNGEVFADGLLQGTWYERGPNNQAGSVIATDFDPASNHIYTVAASGIIFRGNYDGTGWTSLNDDENFNNYVLQVVGGGDRRLVAAKGKKLWYSDNEGADWKAASGLSFYDNWGGPLNLVELNNHELYYLVQTWIANPWGSGYHLYRSTNRGENWTLVQAFTGRDWRRVALWNPYNTNDLYVIDNGQKIHKVNDGTLTLLHDITGLPVANAMWMTGSNASGSTQMYILAENKELYRSEDEGKTWNLQSTLTPPAWGEAGISANPFVGNTLYYGEVNMYKSDDGGSTWYLQNEWWEYYGNTDKLHADIMSFTPATTKDSVDCYLIGNHGGMHLTTDNFITTVNIGTLNLNVGQYYEHVTGFDNGQEYMFIGSQDQGMQRVSTANGNGQEGATQVISGDYVEMAMCRNGHSLFQEYPFGDFSYYHDPFNATWINSSFKVQGEWGQNIQLWSVPMSTVATPAENAVLVGGGTTIQDSGSYLIKLTADTDPPHTITPFHFDYNFRKNANDGDSYITAVAQSPVNPFYYFVAMEDGTFFYSHDDGANWNKAIGFSAPGNGWLYGSSICVSPTRENQLFVGGNGYGGNGVYRSSDGGVSFKAMVTGLPNTFINDLVLNKEETLLFAATEAGPYVCVLSTGKWYSLIGINTPIQPYQSVEYIPATSRVRFTTYGRGVWDFAIENQPLRVDQIGGGKSSSLQIYPSVASSGSRLYLNTDDASGLTLTLFNLAGKMVWTTDWSRQPVLPTLSPGTYLYKISDRKTIGDSSGKIMVVN